MRLSPRSYRPLLPLLAIWAISGGAAAAGTAYRWTDADGVVHYEQTPPANGGRYETVHPSALPPAAGPPVDNGAKAFLKRVEEQDARRAKLREAAAGEKAAAAAVCAEARARLQFLDERPPNRLRERTPGGELKRVDAQDWENDRRKAAEQIAASCNKP